MKRWMFVGLLFASGCWQGPTAEGAFRCSTDSECPPDWVCVTGAGGGRCFSGAGMDAGMDGGAQCSGCVDGTSGVCRGGTTDMACGRAGAMCGACSSGEQCIEGACVTRETCGPGDCAGCCNGTECVAEGRDDACGGGGVACIACGSGEVCSDAECVVPSTCDGSNCTGCCNGDTCLPGDSDSACGEGGDVCSMCGGTQTCRDGFCDVPCSERCNAGCCDGDVCLPGFSDATCGSGGSACEACGTDELCDGVGCVDRGCSETCEGCCSFGACMLGDDSSSCGSAGNMCTICGDSIDCVAGACVPDRFANWEVWVERASFPTRDANGTTWDVTGNPLPDVRATLEAEDFGSPVEGSTATIDNTVSPIWDERVLRNIDVDDLMRGIQITVVDVDTLSFNDTILLCNYAPTNEDFIRGTVVVDCDPSPSVSTSVAGQIVLFLQPE
ncbi:MAG: C2 domain-containing protein [Sandaracinaceae bacterium]